MPARKKQPSDTCTDVVRKITQDAKEANPTGFEFISIAINTVAHRAAVSSSHEAKGNSMTEAEVERAYRHFLMAASLIEATLEQLEELLPEEVLQKHATATEEAKPVTPIEKKEYLN